MSAYRLVAEPADVDVEGIRRALLRRFPYAVYFAVEESTVVVLTVLHAHRDPAAWQKRGG